MALGRAIRNRWRQSFVLSITVLALIAVAVFALVIGRVVAGQIEDQALSRARETVGIVARASFAPRLPRAGMPLAPQDKADLDRQLKAARAQEPGLEMRLWGTDGALIYAAGGSAPSAAGGSGGSASTGGAAAPPAAVQAALAGRPATDVDRDGATDTSPDAFLTSAVPIRRA